MGNSAVRWLVRIGQTLAAALILLLLAGVACFFYLSKVRPETGDPVEAQITTEDIYRAVNLAAWEDTGAIKWVFGGRNTHLWDRKRGLSQVKWGDGYEVLLHISSRDGRAFKNNKELTGEEKKAALKQAYASFINDSFWLQPFANLTDTGVKTTMVPWEGQKALLVEYNAGGVTPGDAYLWELDKNNLPTAWHMWVQILPIKGLEASWSNWKTIDTGARVATEHKLLFLTLRLTDIQGADSLTDLLDGQDDPFERLTSENSTHTPNSQPSSMPGSET